MKIVVVALLLFLAACSNSPAKFAEPGPDAKVWDLNSPTWPGIAEAR